MMSVQTIAFFNLSYSVQHRVLELTDVGLTCSLIWLPLHIALAKGSGLLLLNSLAR